MQNVSMQLVDALERTEGVELQTIILRSPWRGIIIRTFLFLFTLLFRIPKADREFQPDVILFSSMVTAGVIPFLTRKIKAPLVTINHGQDVTLPFWIYQKYLPHVFKKLSGVISVSKATRQACIDRGLEPDKGVALPNGLDSRKLDRMPDRGTARDEIKRRFGLDEIDERYLLLTVGRQVKRKGHVWFINEVLPKISSDVTYLIVGDGPEHPEIRKAAEESGLKDHIVLAGRQSDEVLRMAYAAADLFVMPNIPIEGDMEGFGIVLLEANQASVPAVAADLEGIRDVIEQGVNGYRVPHSRPSKFAEKVDQVLGMELESLSSSSRDYVMNRFSWDTVVLQYVDFLQKVRNGTVESEKIKDPV